MNTLIKVCSKSTENGMRHLRTQFRGAKIGNPK